MTRNANLSWVSWPRIIAVLFSQGSTTEVDDVCAALALMYGYAASYAPSTAIEARIETLVVRSILNSQMMSLRVEPLGLSAGSIFTFVQVSICDLAWILWH